MHERYQEPHDTPPGEAYAAQLRKGFAALRFDPPLERAYRHYTATTLGFAQRVAASLGVLIALLLLGWDAVHFGWRGGGGLLGYAIAVRAATLLALLWVAAAIHRADTHGPGLAALLLLVGGTGLVLSSIGYPPQELRYAAAVMTLVLVAGFFPLGLALWQSVAVALLLCAISAAAGHLLLDGAARDAYLRLQWLLWTAVPVGAVGGYLREHSRREGFLQRRVRDDEALRDALTGLGDRRRFDEHLAVALAERGRLQRGLALILVELDGFAALVQRAGAGAGDRAVLEVAEAMQCLLRPLDVAMRIGANRFALVLYDASGAHLRQVAPALRDMVEVMAIAQDAADAQALTVSVGALLATPEDTPATLMQRAEALLDAARAVGNRVVLAEDTGW
ncbi:MULTISPECIES: GGDEF domain-containing protein [Xanthomonas]|uniref:GGDEF domain-containing protein n=1 Tax=Xanthomonas TaxID=338 RepID=UPI001ADC2A1D|nr:MULTISPECIES: GGDEF domain-containing protein [unclassified Xanthomonas]MBO9872808.1 GGDEF domain-containing protein [Xanthomonas sp. D-93]WNH44970.1 GGDEF domain-containing protein [Xanthomonas sp. A6251]